MHTNYCQRSLGLCYLIILCIKKRTGWRRYWSGFNTCLLHRNYVWSEVSWCTCFFISTQPCTVDKYTSGCDILAVSCDMKWLKITIKILLNFHVDRTTWELLTYCTINFNINCMVGLNTILLECTCYMTGYSLVPGRAIALDNIN